ncbi:MAG: nucleoside:proton symporter [Proteobacteria bacterium]|nr:nucleoside:proton symporter [Pseudomonadota bacterium]
MSSLQGLLGIAVFCLIAWVLSEDRRRVAWRSVVIGVMLQFALGVLLLKVTLFQDFFLALGGIVRALQQATMAGTSFVFGYLGGASLPFEARGAVSTFIFATEALPMLLVFSALSALLYHWRVLPLVVRGFAWVLGKTMKVGGAVGLSTAANVFVGMVAAPLLIRPYLKRLGRGELFIVMTGGMATISGTLMVFYATLLEGLIAEPVRHLLTASIISAPAAIAVAMLMVPDSARTETSGDVEMPTYHGAMDAITRGTLDGLTLLLNIIAMLVVLIALVHLVNAGLALLPDVAGKPPTLQGLLGYAMAPVAWLMGVPWGEALAAGALLGTKTVLNEFVAYLDFAALPQGTLTGKSPAIMVYALCGFANFGSLGIMIGGIGAMAPERRSEIVALGFKSIIAGTIATSMTGAVAGLLI